MNATIEVNKVGKIYSAMVELMQNVGAVSKEKINREQGYKFRGIDDLYNEVQIAMVKAKVFNIAQLIERKDSERKTKSGGTLYTVSCTYKFIFYTVDGSFVESIISVDGADTGDKAPNKAISFAHKYALLTSLNIRTEDEEDPDIVRPEIDKQTYQKKQSIQINEPQQNVFNKCTPQQLKLVSVLLKELNITEEDAKPKWEKITGKKSRTEWSIDDAKTVIDAMKQSLDRIKKDNPQASEPTWEQTFNE